MNAAQIVMMALQISIALFVFSIALRSRAGDVTYLLHRPSLLLRSVLAMYVVMPVVAALIAGVFRLSPPLEIALILLSVSPVPPVLPGKQGKGGGNVSYAIGLLAVAATFAILFAPPSVECIGRLFGHDVHVPMSAIAVVVAKSVVGPLLAGLLVRRLAPGFAARAARPLSLASTLALVIGLVPVLVKMWPAIVAQVTDHTLLAIVVFTLVGLVVGHLLGGPDHDDRTVLALSTACRHPGVAVVIAGAVAGSREAVAPIAATVLLCVLVAAVLTIPYVKWRKRARAAATPAGAPAS
jgi:BASS family bile acid:Na+ symporter